MSEKIRVTDHALVRFAERAIGMDPAALRKEILRQLPAKRCVNGRYPIRYGTEAFKAIVKNGVVVTIVS